jgi:GNAT superfamily N-acetyltransferase
MALLREHRENPVYARLRADAEPRAERLFAAQLESPDEVTFLAMRGDAAIGILRCTAARGYPLLDPIRYAYVSSVYVVPAERRQGVLRTLLLEAEGWSRQRGLTEIRLHSVAGHDGSNAAWESLGFEVVELLRMRRLGAPAGRTDD